MMQTNAAGITDVASHHTVDETVTKLQTILQAKGVILFVLIDHSGEAEKADMKMRPTKLLIFGSPKAGTPLMLAVPSIAIDLPLKILVWEDDHGKVWISYNSPEYLMQRRNQPPNLLQKYRFGQSIGRQCCPAASTPMFRSSHCRFSSSALRVLPPYL